MITKYFRASDVQFSVDTFGTPPPHTKKLAEPLTEKTVSPLRSLPPQSKTASGAPAGHSNL